MENLKKCLAIGYNETETEFPFILENLNYDNKINLQDDSTIKKLKKIIPDNSIGIEIRFNAFYLLLRSLRFPSAPQEYNTVYKQYCDNFTTFKYLPMLRANSIRYRTKDRESYKEAAGYIKKAMKNIPNSISFKRNYASLLMEYYEIYNDNDIDDEGKDVLIVVKKILEDVIKQKPDFAIYHHTYARYLLLKKDYDNAMDHLANAERLETESAKIIEYNILRARINQTRSFFNELKEIESKSNDLKSTVESLSKRIENSKYDLIQTLGLFAAIITFVISTLVSSHNMESMNLQSMTLITITLAFTCSFIFSVFQILFSFKISTRFIIMLIVSLIGMLGTYFIPSI